MDTGIREKERAALAGDLQARGRMLRQRLRAGQVSQDALTLAAYCGDGGAALAVDWNHFYVVVNSGNAAFVKYGDYFESQGGLTEKWGENWRKVWAPKNDHEMARAQAKIETWFKGLDPWGSAPQLLALATAGLIAAERWADDDLYQRINEAEEILGQDMPTIWRNSRPEDLALLVVSFASDGDESYYRAIIGRALVNLQQENGYPLQALFPLWAAATAAIHPEDRKHLLSDGMRAAIDRLPEIELRQRLTAAIIKWALRELV